MGCGLTRKVRGDGAGTGDRGTRAYVSDRGDVLGVRDRLTRIGRCEVVITGDGDKLDDRYEVTRA